MNLKNTNLATVTQNTTSDGVFEYIYTKHEDEVYCVGA